MCSFPSLSFLTSNTVHLVQIAFNIFILRLSYHPPPPGSQEKFSTCKKLNQEVNIWLVRIQVNPWIKLEIVLWTRA